MLDRYCRLLDVLGDYIVKRLHRSSREKVLCGVCGGLAEYLNTDPILIRLAAIALFLINPGAAIILYIAACVLMPKSHEEVDVGGGGAAREGVPKAGNLHRLALLAVGAVLILTGALVITRRLFPWNLFDALKHVWSYLTSSASAIGALVLIAVGALFIAIAVRKGAGS